MKKVSNWPEFHFKEVTSYKICISIHNFFLSLDSSHEPTKGTDGKPIILVVFRQPEKVGGPGPAGHFVQGAVEQLVIHIPHQPGQKYKYR